MKDWEEVYKYGFNPYLNDSEKENPGADFDKDGITNVDEAEIYGTDPLNTDTDCDKIDDFSEMRGINVRYIVDKGTKGYLFYKDAPAIYDKTFTYKTSPFNPNTDLDGQNDYNDLIPLDYDMDGDRKINSGRFVTVGDAGYVERLAIAANNDPNLLRDASGNVEDDLDIDNDSVHNFGDLDMDADGMSDEYEVKYGDIVVRMAIDSEWVENEVQGQGWQNPYIYNARYAILLGGNDDACVNDILEMYNKLKGYNYLDENIFCYIWNKPEGYENKVDGSGTEENIIKAFASVGSEITRNDFFYFSEICHGAGDNIFRDGSFSCGSVMCYFGYMGKPNLTGFLSLYIKYYARSVFVMSSCGCGYAAYQLHGENRIIITASSIADWIATGNGRDVCYTLGDLCHFAFVHEGRHYYWARWPYPHWDYTPYPGFTPSLGTSDYPSSILYAFSKGYDAATHNYQDGGRRDISHPALEDNNDGIGSCPENLSSTDSRKDGYLSAHTYL